LVLTVLAAVTACRYDRDDRCGPHQRLDDTGVCACEPHARLDVARGTCVPCGDREEARGERCECKAGFARPGPGAACAPVVEGLGDPCGPARACTTAAFPHCRVAPGASEGYCTRAGCAATADCPAGWACDTASTPPSCQRPPTGQGKACAGPADCAGLEAGHCETFFVKACLVEGCKVEDPKTCHEGWRCCDVTKLGLPKTLCLAVEACP
jgi:hypothetical protein